MGATSGGLPDPFITVLDAIIWGWARHEGSCGGGIAHIRGRGLRRGQASPRPKRIEPNDITATDLQATRVDADARDGRLGRGPRGPSHERWEWLRAQDV